MLFGLLGILALFMTIDWMWVVPMWVRALALLAVLGLSVALYLQFRRPYSSRQAAADAEAKFPQLGQRLRTVLQYADPGSETAPASPGLLKALGRETDRRSTAIDFRKLIPWPLFERSAVGLILTAIALLIALLASPSIRTAGLRMLFLPAHYTKMSIEPGNLTLTAGEELKLAVTLEGRPVNSAQWFHRNKTDGAWIAASLAPDPEPGERAKPLEGLLTATLKDCQEDFEYRVAAGELESQTYHVKVVHPLVVKALQATITPPNYTRQPAVVLSDGTWNAIDGSRVEIEIQLDRTPSTAMLELKAGGQPLPERVDLQIDGAKLSGVLAAVSKDLELELTAADADGVALEPQKRRIKVAADHEPTIRVHPARGVAGRDYHHRGTHTGRSSRRLRAERAGNPDFKVGDGPEETLYLGRLQDQPRTATALETLYVEKYALDYQGAITYYAFAEDNYSHKPHRVVSELRFIDILPFKQDYQFVEGEGSCNGNSTSLEELITRQRENLNRTFVRWLKRLRWTRLPQGGLRSIRASCTPRLPSLPKEWLRSPDRSRRLKRPSRRCNRPRRRSRPKT